MKRAIELAAKGEGWVHPNPMVGAVIVKDGQIIGEGYHRKFGELHAERNAIASLNQPAEGATIYVTLEPCCHHGKTPPCTDAIIENKIARVVIGSRDPNPLVAGQGAKILRDAGITVEEDFMRDECDRLNPVFFHYITTGLPYVIMKYAMTADGKIATKTGASKWISGEESRKEVHRMRHACMGIMAGIGTVKADDPMLNCRLEAEDLPAGEAESRDPVRIICDSNLSISPDTQIVKTAKDIETIIVCANEDVDKAAVLREKGAEVLALPGEDGKPDLKKLMKILGERGIDSLLIEGGGTLNENALKAGIVNEVRAFVAPKLFGGTAKSPVMGEGVETPDEAYRLEMTDIRQTGEDLMIRYRVLK
ncbi:MAG: bifunctional diaminohydroxyphosphoribosylaminopyrimidine deaminase/5-amino-6-(5-phosphoribosylamino)uracil reductase RibD [Firmicutes bacterium]|nr:bifunctional diaminohydroxyphosphoribosylaminopyrimidine deaminase/5-amino-6-(5-phosphoribosylamino)uracil reductase RibD [Bacillota bacterium]